MKREDYEKLKNKSKKSEILIPEYKKPGNVNEFSYVCPHCFYSLDSCECSKYPEQIVEIDKPLLGSIRKLNQKGYATAFCCSGHPWSEGKSRETDIKFYTNYKFGKRVPRGWKRLRNGQLVYKYPEMSEEEFVIEREKVCKRLEQWVDELVDHEEWKRYLKS